jgi:hypothetical protein
MLPPPSSRARGERSDYLKRYKESSRCWLCDMAGNSGFEFDHAAEYSNTLKTHITLSTLFTGGSARRKWVFEWLLTQLLCGTCHNTKNHIERQYR